MTTFIFLRHAEREYGADAIDHSLTAQGFARAKNLVNILGDMKIDAIYATRFQRTQQTVAVLAQHLEISITVENEDRIQIVKLLKKHPGETVLICGHSYSLPRLFRELGVGDYFEALEHGNILIVQTDDAGMSKIIQRLKF